MRIAVLADIHGNLRALEAVHADLLKRSPDVIVNLGDNVSGPLQAAETADWLIQRSWAHIRGNQDRQLVDRAPAEMGPSDRAAHAQLNRRQLDWIASLPPMQLLTEDVLLCHGSPRSDLESLLEQVDGDRVRLASARQIEERLGGVRATLVFCGHTHVPRVVSSSRGVWVVNPGSVGLPAYDDTWTAQHPPETAQRSLSRPDRGRFVAFGRAAPALCHYVETGSPHARYAVVDWDGRTMRAELIAIAYDWESASKEAARAGRPDWAHALATGYALRPSE
jgi:putative phosphoesterase